MIVFVVPGRLGTPTGGYIYDSQIIEGLKRRGIPVELKELRGAFPQPAARHLTQAAQQLASIPDDALVIVDGLAGGAMPVEIEREASRLRFVALVHHPLALETGVTKAEAARLRATELRTLKVAKRVVVTSPATARLLVEKYRVSATRISCVEPGTERWPIASRTRGRALELLCVATLTPRKGHVTLVRALAKVRDLDWHLTCVGASNRDRATAMRVRAEIRKAGLERRISLVGETSSRAALKRHYQHADVFVLPTEYEGYGMAVAEAIASGLPVVSTPTGAIAELVGEKGGILVPPGNVSALASALGRMLGDADARRAFTQGARRRRMQLPSWAGAVREWSAILRRVAAE